jgi:hypothetical protein
VGQPEPRGKRWPVGCANAIAVSNKVTLPLTLLTPHPIFPATHTQEAVVLPGTVQVPVPNAQGLLDDAGGVRGGDLPGAKPHQGHQGATGKADGGTHSSGRLRASTIGFTFFVSFSTFLLVYSARARGARPAQAPCIFLKRKHRPWEEISNTDPGPERVHFDGAGPPPGVYWSTCAQRAALRTSNSMATTGQKGGAGGRWWRWGTAH